MISTDLSKLQFDALFSNVDDRNIVDRVEFINPYEKISSLHNNETAEASGKV